MTTNTPKAKTTKKAQLVRLLSTKAGADAVSLGARLGWQAHTTRAAIAGLRKAGYEIVAEKPGAGKPTRYRIVAEPDTGGAASPPAPAAEVVDAG
ncbi:DUF3489 domain-containing protein [Jannaschia formosa]|uniref:DUF3489 domain-containing protein n=1 Tax=Jannaschia formosa TaxID=2259592 RepID=UPI000E1BCC08|nr:DUF3489 domain-containing protein [Jannaschia formosa]TFL16119.1 DUF3489 domain-containing protein [Jannaschia formosa]